MAVDIYEPDRPEHEVEIRTLAKPEIVEISADVDSGICDAELLRFLADYIDSREDHGFMLQCSIRWNEGEDKWILTATIDH